MRKYLEPTARNLLRPVLVMGVPLPGMMALAGAVLMATVLAGTSFKGNLLALVMGGIGYAGLRALERFSLNGWEQTAVWVFERWLSRRAASVSLISLRASSVEVQAPDTLAPSDLVRAKDGITPLLSGLRKGARLCLMAKITPQGAQIMEITRRDGATPRDPDWRTLTQGLFTGSEHVYSLHALPVFTDPLWMFSQLKDLPRDVRVIASFKGLDSRQTKRRIEISRRRSSHVSAGVSQVDSDITFEEASEVLRGISRGDEAVLEAALVVISRQELDLDPALFVKERTPGLSVSGVLGLRPEFHRKHLLRLSTACDLVPNILDPAELAAEILKTPRGNPLYFSPNDPRLESLHWLVVGATGSGKSFFTGLMLKRMIEGGEKLSVLFLDHNRSFRRLVKGMGGEYLELSQLGSKRTDVIDPIIALAGEGAVSGIELSDLDLDAKRDAVRCIFSHLEALLKNRDTTHPVYLVLDECWHFLRDEPALVQRAFREFRKLNGAVIAITQSLSDFVTSQTGQTIFQNAPVRILLRQGEDLSSFQAALSLNEVELERLRLLRQSKGEWAECLIKTPYLSRLGRLHPTPEEHELLRTDNLREEWVSARKPQTPAAVRSPSSLGARP